MSTIQQVREAQAVANKALADLLVKLEKQDQLNQAVENAVSVVDQAKKEFQTANEAAIAYAPEVIAAENNAAAAFQTVADLLLEEGLPQ